MRSRSTYVRAILAIGAVAILCIALFQTNKLNARPESISRTPFGVLGDSDSHSFHDSIILSAPNLRGGVHRDVTFQWTEVIARLRADQIDMGEWGIWGAPGTIAYFKQLFGAEDRAPRKQDYRYNLAISGAKCRGLTEGMSRQTQRLIYLMNQSPKYWENGIVTIRIGINNLGTYEALNTFAASGLSQQAAQDVAECTNYIRKAVQLIRAEHTKTRIVLVGILSNADWTPWLANWQSPAQISNISAVMDAFDTALRGIASSDPNILFWDDRAWFTRYWGERNKDGFADYHAACLRGVSINYAQGDDPHNATLSDGHTGTAWNGFWARDLLDTLNSRFGYKFVRINDDDIAHLAGLISAPESTPQDHCNNDLIVDERHQANTR